ncbi:MAG: nucleoside monophosphate kinase [Patescibacteria group bacterium]
MDKNFDLKKKLRHAVIIILGAPGSGKGTQSALLADKLSFYHIETSKLLEEAFAEAKPGQFVKIKGKKYFLADEKKLWETGILCSVPLTYHLIEKRVKDLHEEGENLILSASPRTVDEAERLVPLLKNLYGGENIRVIVLDIKPKETLFRNSHRRICKLIRHPILYSKDNINLKFCPLDGSRLLKRRGLDDPNSILVRLQEYKEMTFPLVKYFKKEKLCVKTLNGSLSPSKVFENILKALK